MQLNIAYGALLVWCWNVNRNEGSRKHVQRRMNTLSVCITGNSHYALAKTLAVVCQCVENLSEV